MIGESANSQKMRCGAAVAEDTAVAHWASSIEVPQRTAYRWAAEPEPQSEIEAIAVQTTDTSYLNQARLPNEFPSETSARLPCEPGEGGDRDQRHLLPHARRPLPTIETIPNVSKLSHVDVLNLQQLREVVPSVRPVETEGIAVTLGVSSDNGSEARNANGSIEDSYDNAEFLRNEATDPPEGRRATIAIPTVSRVKIATTPVRSNVEKDRRSHSRFGGVDRPERIK